MDGEQSFDELIWSVLYICPKTIMGQNGKGVFHNLWSHQAF
jgi:hypothetical protein